MPIIALLCLMVVIGRVAFDLYIPALPVIQASLQANAQLSVTLFSLGFGVSQLFYGPLSDRYGRRIIILMGTLLFMLGSLWAALAHNMTQLIMARFISGCGVGAGVIMARAISRDMFDGKKLVRVMSLLTMAIIIALFCAPILGGYLTQRLSWRADFYFLIFFGLICFATFYKWLPETQQHTASTHLWDHIKQYTVITKNITVMRYILIASCAFAGLVIYFQLTPFIFEQHYGLSTETYSWLSGIIVFTFFIGTISLNIQIKKLSASTIIWQGCIAMFIGGILLLMLHITHHDSLSGILASTMLYVYGLRLIIPTATAEILSPFKTHAGVASALLGAILMIISAAVSAIVAQSPLSHITMLSFTYVILSILCLLLHTPAILLKSNLFSAYSAEKV